MLEALGYSKTSALTRATRRNIPEEDILRIHPRESLKSYIESICPPEYAHIRGGKISFVCDVLIFLNQESKVEAVRGNISTVIIKSCTF
jgi:hypothetical protein